MSMTLTQVHASLQRIVDLSQAESHEVAHIAEDQLFADVLAAIADGTCDDPKACARAALTSVGIQFERGCANGDRYGR